MDDRQFNFFATETRVAGVLLHPTSLPGAFPVGDFGPEAFRFLDWMAAAGLRLWQVLPLSVPDDENSPYGSLSVFAGAACLISPQQLVDDGLLSEAEGGGDAAAFDNVAEVDYVAAACTKEPLLRRAADRFFALPPDTAMRKEFAAFAERNSWLQEHCLFMALRKANDGGPWWEWTAGVDADHRPLPDAMGEFAADIRYHQFVQFIFQRQWRAVREYGRQRGIAILGDLPIYVAEESCDVWSHRDLFQLDAAGRPTAVAGVPPDYFAEDGQLWNNPLYNWDKMQGNGFAWWIRRMEATLDLVDMVRLDHFRGYDEYWAVPAGEETARNGKWMPGPGNAFFQSLLDALRPRSGPVLPLVAEDLGHITESVTELRERFHLPGTKVLQFALEHAGDEKTLTGEIDPATLLYTGTHDNDTTVGWYRSVIAPDATKRERAWRYLALAAGDSAEDDARAVARRVLELAWSSPAQIALAPMQDFLGLGAHARMNVPGTSIKVRRNWVWRMRAEDLTPRLAEEIGAITCRHGRGAPNI